LTTGVAGEHTLLFRECPSRHSSSERNPAPSTFIGSRGFSGRKESNMKKLILASLAFPLLVSVVALAQDTMSQDTTKTAAHKTASHTKTVTGCLQKGDEPGEFSITGKDGKTWGLRSTTVKLDQHVGHEVTVTGSPHRESKAEQKAEKTEENKEGQMEKASGKEEYRDLRVTSLKMVSETCSK
jgi:hypothetical protein